MVHADKNPFLADMKMFEALFYSSSLMPIRELSNYVSEAVSEVNLTPQGFQFKTEAES